MATQAAAGGEADSIRSQDPHMEEKKKTKSRRPANTAFRQQRLKAWQPILTPKTVLPLFFLVGIIFAPIGGLLLYASSQVQEISLDYTECTQKAPIVPADETKASSDLATIPSEYVSYSFKKKPRTAPKWGRVENENYTWPHSGHTQTNISACILSFSIEEDIKPPVLLYYRLTNFYQNHRRYVKSLDIEQLKGDAVPASKIKGGECDPLEVDSKTGKPYYPCGLIANSMFNDTYGDLFDAARNATYNMTEKGISWATEADLYGKSKYKPEDVVPPPNWALQYPNGSESEDGKSGYAAVGRLPDLKTWEAFQVWMRTAGLPTFSKLAKRNDGHVLQAGTYRIKIYENFKVQTFGGTKSLLLSTRTVMGGKNPFLGIAYIVVGGLCIVLGAVFTATHLIKPRKLGDHTYLSWNNETPQQQGAAATVATGRSVGNA